MPWYGWVTWLLAAFMVRRVYDTIATNRRLKRLLTEAEVRQQYGDDWEGFLDEQPPMCPACCRLLELHRANPRLSLGQLNAVIERQVAAGRCPQHGDLTR